MKLLLAALMALLMSNAFAGVTYTWRTVFADDQHLPLNVWMTIVFTEEAVRSGGVSFEADSCIVLEPEYCFKDPNGPIQWFAFSGGENRDFGLSPQDYFNIDQGLRIEGQFVGNRFEGSIWAKEVHTEVFIDGGVVQYLWSEYAFSDPNDPCGMIPEECSGAQGVIETDALPVPEPSSIVLLGLALSGFMIARRGPKSVTTNRKT